MSWKVLQGDVLDKLAEIKDGTIQCCVTSPPYWGLRDYGIDGQIYAGISVDPELIQHEHVKANMRLIESAPDMYCALWVALSVLSGLVQKEGLHPDQKGYLCEGYAAYQQVEEALEKAEGRERP